MPRPNSHGCELVPRYFAVVLYGEFGPTNRDELAAQCQRARSSASPDIVLDLRLVDVLDPTCFDVITQFAGRAMSSGRRLTVLCGEPRLRRRLAAAGLLAHWDLPHPPG